MLSAFAVAAAIASMLCAIEHDAVAIGRDMPDAAATEINVGSVTCQRYQNEILHPREPAGPSESHTSATVIDPIDTTMWLLGFSTGRTGDHVMYGDALASFGFALDAECRNNASESLLRAVTNVRPKQDNPMDLQRLTCEVWGKRHADMQRTDAESANTLMMWMYGYSVAQNGGLTLQFGALPAFTSSVEGYCAANANSSLADALLKTRPPGVPPPGVISPRGTQKAKARASSNAPQ